MGTNYYARIDTCPVCGRYDEFHIGKRSGGWVFVFRAYDQPEDWQARLTTVDEWRPFTKRSDIEIYDEYGELVEYGDFWRMVEETLNEPRNDLFDGDYLSDGYRFSTYDFS